MLMTMAMIVATIIMVGIVMLTITTCLRSVQWCNEKHCSDYIPNFCLIQIHKSTISVFVDGRLLNPSIHDAILVAPATASQYRVGQSLDGNVDVQGSLV